MHPILLEGPFGYRLASYGTLVVVGILATVPGLWWDARRRGLTALFALDFYAAVIVGSVVGGEILHLLTRADRYLAAPALLRTDDALGLVYYGSVLGMLGAMAWVARRHGRPTAEVVGMVLTWGQPAHAFGRLGCFMAGCCYGAPSDAAWAMGFPEGSVAWEDGSLARHGGTTVPLHPVQLYEAAGLFALGGLLVAGRLRRGPETGWVTAARWAVGYGVLRLFTEVFRSDPDRRALLQLRWPDLASVLALPPEQPLLLSTSQAIALGMIAWGIATMVRARKGLLPSTAPR